MCEPGGDFEDDLEIIGYTAQTLPRGVIVATVALYDCVRFDKMFEPYEQILYGDFRPGRYGFLLKDIKEVSPPIPARGALGLWDWDDTPPQPQPEQGALFGDVRDD